MGFTVIDFIFTVIINVVPYINSDHILSCNTSALFPCPGAHQICFVKSGQCVCEKDFILIEKECKSDNSRTSPMGMSVVTKLFIIFTLVLIILCGLVLVIRKYKLVDYVRQRINLQRNNDVVYEDVMIGHDDPPLSP